MITFKPARFDRRRAALLAATAAWIIPAAAMAAGTGFTTDARTVLPASTLAGHTSGSKVLSLTVMLPSRNPAGLASFVSHVSQPGDPLYRHYLTPARFAALYGANPSDYRAIADWAKAHALQVGEEYSAHTALPITGTVENLERAFGVRFSDYTRAGGSSFYNASGAPHLPDVLAGKIASILGFNSISRPQPMVRRLPAGAVPRAAGSGPLGAYSASDIRNAYQVPAAAVGVTGETVAVFEAGGFAQSDITTYLTANNLAKRSVVVRKVNGYGGGIDDPNVDLEAALDIDMVIGTNPGVKKVLVYEDGENDPFGTELVNSLSAIGTDNLAQTVSISYGEDEALQDPADIQAENVILQQLTAQGITVFVSAGDHGAYGDLGQGLNAPDPGAQPLVTSVGGTSLFTGANGTYLDEIVWNELSRGFATGGGVSAVWPIPTYQLQNGNGRSVALNNGGSATNRNFPDVAAVADPYTGVAVYSALNGGWLEVGGTSASAPIWAAYMSIANGYSKMLGLGQIGFANPGIYEIGPRTPEGGGGYNDIADGTNGDAAIYGIPGFSAGYGYDNVSGWGSPLPNLSNSFALLPLRYSSNPNPPPAVSGLHGKAGATSATIDFVRASGATGYLITAQNVSTRLFANQVITQRGTAVISGLAPDSDYQFQVYSISPGGVTASIDLFLKTASAN